MVRPVLDAPAPPPPAPETSSAPKPAAAPPVPTPPGASSGSGAAPSGGSAASSTGGTTNPMHQYMDDLGMKAGALTTVPDVETMMFGVKPPPPDKLQAFADANPGAGVVLGLDDLKMPNPVVPDLPLDIDEIRDITERQDREGLLKGRRPKSGQSKVKPMSWDDYEALTDQQRSAVDFNTMLTQAVARDRKTQDSLQPSDFQRQVYDASVEDMFGEDGGSKLYAPETMAVLKQIQFKDNAADLDDFLKLKVAVTSADLKDWNPAAASGQGQLAAPGEEQSGVISLQKALADKTHIMEAALVTGDSLLQSVNAMARVARADDLGNMGGQYKPVRALPGFDTSAPREGGIDLNQQFRYAFDVLSQRQNTGKLEEILGKMNPSLLEPFMSYVDTRTRLSLDHSLVLGDTEGVDYQTPEEFRVLLGLDKKEKANG